MPRETRAETTEDPRFCTGADSFISKDTDDIDISELSITGVADKGDADYDATMTVLRTMFDADNIGTFLMTHPDGVMQKWANIKLLEVFDDPDGAASDKVKFTVRAQLHSRLSET